MIIRVLAVSLALGMLSVGPASAGTFTSKVVAHDRVASRIVVEDMSVVQYDESTEMPEELNAGDRVEVEFTGSEGQMDKIVAVKVVEAAQ